MRKSLLPLARLFGLTLTAILSGCQTTKTPSIETTSVDFCTAAKPIYYSKKQDSLKTIQQIAAHNQVGVALNCGWLKK